MESQGIAERSDADRRVKLVPVSERTVLDSLAFGMASRLPEYVSVPRIDLPAGATVVAVHHNYFNRTFDFVVKHESFEPLREGEYLPREDGCRGYEVVRVRRHTDADTEAAAAEILGAWQTWSEEAMRDAQHAEDEAVYRETMLRHLTAALRRHVG